MSVPNSTGAERWMPGVRVVRTYPVTPPFSGNETGVPVGHPTSVKLDQTRAEVAVEVADHLPGRGLGTILIERLAAIAEQRGITLAQSVRTL